MMECHRDAVRLPLLASSLSSLEPEVDDVDDEGSGSTESIDFIEVAD